MAGIPSLFPARRCRCDWKHFIKSINASTTAHLSVRPLPFAHRGAAEHSFHPHRGSGRSNERAWPHGHSDAAHGCTGGQRHVVSAGVCRVSGLLGIEGLHHDGFAQPRERTREQHEQLPQARRETHRRGEKIAALPAHAYPQHRADARRDARAGGLSRRGEWEAACLAERAFSVSRLLPKSARQTSTERHHQACGGQTVVLAAQHDHFDASPVREQRKTAHQRRSGQSGAAAASAGHAGHSSRLGGIPRRRAKSRSCRRRGPRRVARLRRGIEHDHHLHGRSRPSLSAWQNDALPLRIACSARDSPPRRKAARQRRLGQRARFAAHTARRARLRLRRAFAREEPQTAHRRPKRCQRA